MQQQLCLLILQCRKLGVEQGGAWREVAACCGALQQPLLQRSAGRVQQYLPDGGRR